MNITLRYFAWVREKAGIAEETVDLPPDAETVGDVIRWLKTRGPEFAAAFERDTVIRAAIDQTHVKHSTPVAGARELAFFPPVTGG
jgi:molybdopterin synthase sulfur carrier subunit